MKDDATEEVIEMYDAMVDTIKKIVARAIEITRDAVRYIRRVIESICVNLDELRHVRQFIDNEHAKQLRLLNLEYVVRAMRLEYAWSRMDDLP